MEPDLFASGEYLDIQEKVVRMINAHERFLTDATSRSTRAAGDAIQSIVEENFERVLGDRCASYSADFPRRAMEDLAFRDRQGREYVVDVKTHRLDTKFNMPNLVSVERLSRYYEEEGHYFVLLIIRYGVEGNALTVRDVHFVPIEYLDWDCLTIGALGWGQIQIANSNRLQIRPQDRREWMDRLCRTMLDFYPKEIRKIEKRLAHFRSLHEKWKSPGGRHPPL